MHVVGVRPWRGSSPGSVPARRVQGVCGIRPHPTRLCHWPERLLRAIKLGSSALLNFETTEHSVRRSSRNVFSSLVLFSNWHEQIVAGI